MSGMGGNGLAVADVAAANNCFSVACREITSRANMIFGLQ